MEEDRVACLVGGRGVKEAGRARSRDLVAGEVSSTLPREEEEPQRTSYAAAGGVCYRGVGLG